jgi:hypothetical protein
MKFKDRINGLLRRYESISDIQHSVNQLYLRQMHIDEYYIKRAEEI